MKCLLLLLLGTLSAFGQAFSPSDLPFRDQAGGTDWARRVVANGGASPSGNTIACMESLRTRLISMGLTNKLYSLCIFVPDSVIAASTPLFKHKGSDPWTNFNFAASNLTINGLIGDGTSKALDTGVKAKTGEAADNNDGSRGLSVIITESDTNASKVAIGYQDGDDTITLLLAPSDNGVTGWFPMQSASASLFITTNDWQRVGFISGNVETNSGTTNISLYVASPLEAFKLLSSKTINNVNSTSTENTISVFAKKHDTTNQAFTGQRISMAAVHDGFTQAEVSNFWFAVRTCRECLGGGTGDNVHDWNQRIVNNGGAAISTTTSNAFRTFYAGLDTDALLYRLIFANGYPPDNLTAVRTPIIVQAGSLMWSNNNFAASNLTINGLTGNTTSKSFVLNINFTTLTMRGFGSANAGISTMTFNIPMNSNVDDIATQGTAANSYFGLANYSGNAQFLCWKALTVNTEFLSWPTPRTNMASYLSGNRTAANAIALYVGTNGTFFAATNGTGNQTGSTSTITNITAHARWVAPGAVGPSSWSDRTISFMALHPGLTITESSNLYVRANALRTALGGGSP